MIWYQEKCNDDIMVSTRIRLARNLKSYPFPGSMTVEQAKKPAGWGITISVRSIC